MLAGNGSMLVKHLRHNWCSVLSIVKVAGDGACGVVFVVVVVVFLVVLVFSSVVSCFQFLFCLVVCRDGDGVCVGGVCMCVCV